jgi:glutamyl-tRNA synthetase
VRFCPSPTGNPHVGMVRTALFNWAFARHTGGTFVFRIEDTDSARDSEQSYRDLLDALRWLGLDWDEGPEVGGPHAPYRQSQRLDVYADVARRLAEGGYAYPCFCTAEELEERREQQRANNLPPGYDGRCRALGAEEVQARRDAGLESVLRVKMPGGPVEWDDLVRGPIRFEGGSVPDYVIVRSNGEPLYTLVNPVDDALMGITHVLRGEDLLSSTPRQVALYDALRALGITDAVPRFGHLPYVMGEGNKKLSKRDPQSSLNAYRDGGFVPEGLLNYLALLGWSIAEDRDIFSMAEMAEAFDIGRVNPNPARFDLKKCTAINADWIRRLEPADLAGRLEVFLQGAGILPETPSAAQRALLAAATPLVQERMTTLAEGPGMLGFLFADGPVAVEPDARAALPDVAGEVLDAALAALDGLDPFDAATVEGALRAALVDGLGLKPKVAFGPVRVAVTGRRVSPPLFESMELLGAPAALERLRGLRASL